MKAALEHIEKDLAATAYTMLGIFQALGAGCGILYMGPDLEISVYGFVLFWLSRIMSDEMERWL